VLLVLWDVDGTLVDTAGYGRHAFDDAFEELFGRRPEGQVPFAGRTDHQIALSILERNGVEGAEADLPRMLETLAETLVAKEDRIRAEGRAMPGAREALEALATRDDVVQSLLTGNVEANAVVKLAAFGLDSLLDFAVGGYGSDPHVERSDLVAVARRRVAEKHGVEVGPEATVLVGDTPLDVRAAREAGARAVAVASGPHHGVEELADAGADAVLEDLRDTAAVVAAVAG
jgi:phosphoglycolate phosphatase-like HAD superfamily hydrolase